MATESYQLKVRDVIVETEDARSVVFDVPADLEDTFAYSPGQFLTLAVPSVRTGVVARCYSLSSAPHEGLHRITVKRTVDGYASNWIVDHLRPGDVLRVLPPSGIFTPKDLSADLLLVAGGSGITPVLSIARTALEKGSGRVVMLYANRDERSVIFAETLRELAVGHPDRFVLVHWLESVQGLPTSEQLSAFASAYADHSAFVCGPAPFMEATMSALKELGFPRERRHQEKFVSLAGNPFGDVSELELAQHVASTSDDPEHADEAAGELDRRTDSAAGGPAIEGPFTVEVELDGQEHTFDDWSGTEPLLDFLESKGLDAPFSCREGQCSACACMVLEGEVAMANNEVLDDEDLADGVRLACQSRPASERLKITYAG